MPLSQAGFYFDFFFLIFKSFYVFLSEIDLLYVSNMTSIIFFLLHVMILLCCFLAFFFARLCFYLRVFLSIRHRGLIFFLAFDISVSMLSTSVLSDCSVWNGSCVVLTVPD